MTINELRTNKEGLVNELRETLSDDLEEAVTVAREINAYNGDLEWANSCCLDEHLEFMKMDSESVLELIDVIVDAGMDSTDEILLRYDGCGELEAITEDDLESDAEDYMDDIIESLLNIPWRNILFPTDIDDILNKIENIDTMELTDLIYDYNENEGKGVSLDDMTVEDLSNLLAELPSDAKISFGGSEGYIYSNEDGSQITIDSEEEL